MGRIISISPKFAEKRVLMVPRKKLVYLKKPSRKILPAMAIRNTVFFLLLLELSGVLANDEPST